MVVWIGLVVSGGKVPKWGHLFSWHFYGICFNSHLYNKIYETYMHVCLKFHFISVPYMWIYNGITHYKLLSFCSRLANFIMCANTKQFIWFHCASDWMPDKTFFNLLALSFHILTIFLSFFPKAGPEIAILKIRFLLAAAKTLCTKHALCKVSSLGGSLVVISKSQIWWNEDAKWNLCKMHRKLYCNCEQ